MQPHHRTPDIEQAGMQPIPFSKVNSRHPDSSTAIVATIVSLDCLAPEFADLLGTVVETNVDEEVAIRGVGLKIFGRLVRRPLSNVGTQQPGAVPALELARTLGFVIQRGSERDNSLDLPGLLDWGVSYILCADRYNVPFPVAEVPFER